jgi:hypothetical protein
LGRLALPCCHGGRAGRHAELAEELIEWWDDLCRLGAGSRVVLVAVPPGWGRTTVLKQLAEAVGAADAPVTLLARIGGQELPDEHALQAAALGTCLAGAVTRLLPDDSRLDRAAEIANECSAPATRIPSPSGATSRPGPPQPGTLRVR